MDPTVTAYLARREACVAKLRAILVEELHLDYEPDAIDLDAPLFGTGLALDSVDALQLVAAIESAFRLTIEQEQLRVSLRSLNTLADLVLSRQDAAGGAP